MAEHNEIRTETDYAAALARVEELMDAEPGTSDGEELDTLVDLIECYENKHEPWSIPAEPPSRPSRKPI